MEFSTEVRTFWLIAATGMLLGVLFDVYSLLRGRYSPPWLVTAVTDLLYCLAAAGIAFAALLLGNWGELRFYVVLALVSGVVVYCRLLSCQVRRYLLALFRLLAGIGRAVRNVVVLVCIRPVVKAIQLICLPVALVKKKYCCWRGKWRRPPPG